MDKIKVKRELKNIKRDLDYYMNNYELSQKEAYELLHEVYYMRMMLTKKYVEIEIREKIYNEYKTTTEEEIKQ